MYAGVVLLAHLVGVGSFVMPAGALTQKSSAARNLDNCHPQVLAHRGASGYVPEHTLGAYALAVTMGTDYVEPDLVMTSDGHLIARHENELSLTTDVAERQEFANRYRTQTVDGRTISGWFSEHFTLAEVKTLRSRELLPSIRPGNTRMNDAFEIPTLQEIIDLVKGLELSEQRIIGICPEIKHGSHFQRIGLAMEQPLVNILHRNGYVSAESPIYIQSFEVSNLRELHSLTDLRLIQLYGGSAGRPFDQAELNTNLTYGVMATAEGLREVATYAFGVGPEKSYIISRINNSLGAVTSFVADAHAAGLFVHPYTFRSENAYLPVEFRSSDDLTAIGNFSGELSAFFAAGVDGVFSDQPDVPVRLRGYCRSPLPSSSSLVSSNVLLALINLLVVLLHKITTM